MSARTNLCDCGIEYPATYDLCPAYDPGSGKAHWVVQSWKSVATAVDAMLPAGAENMAEPVGSGSFLANLAAETRVVDPDTGGEKGSKLARFDLIPWDVLTELAEHYGIGSRKYDDRNWERGYVWGLSIAALGRHLSAWIAGEDTDPESGDSHLIAVAWHAFALRWFQLHGKGTDTRSSG